MKNVPQLRFKEFSGEWEEINILELSSMKARIGWQNLRQDEHLDFGEYYLVTGTDFVLNKINWKNAKYVDYERYIQDKHIILEEGDILITKDGSIGKLAYVQDLGEKQATLNNGVFRIRVFSQNSQFIFYTFFTKRFQFFLHQLAGGSSIKHLYQKDFETYKVVTPTSLKEQTKIANFLSAIDDKISQLTRKVQLLKQYKKGIMQQIFSQQLRFKDDDGEDFPEWEEKNFLEIFEFIATNSFSRELLTYNTGAVKNIHYGDIHTKFKTQFKIDNENVPFIRNNVDISRIPQQCFCKQGDLIIADASEDYADIGKAIEIINLDNQRLLSGLHTYIARDTKKQLALGFAGYLMQTETVRLQIKKLATGISVLGISKKNIAQVNFKLPTLPEQTKIANFLSAIDDKIEQTQKQLDNTKQYKKGLLQKMFV